MDIGYSFGLFSFVPFLLFVVYGLFILLGLTALFLLIKLMMRAITALELYIDEKRSRGF
ncbi:hypothetical protein [Paenibacillus sp. 1P07SE]|uniref:hypothetical protein n=1 Tax=Paenibacillus sp. 1P07SE TaxID=3132209 RepID=UPI0039A74BFB